MPSTTKIIPKCSQIIQQQLLPHIPKKWRGQFKFGVQALTLKPFSSLASNARQTVANPATASTKMDRLINNLGLAETISAAVTNFGIIHPSSLINCDHSDFNGLTAFVGAIQTKKGRAIPCMVATTYSQRLPAHSQAPKRKQRMRSERSKLNYGIYEQVRTTLDDFAGRLGFWPRFVFDRGFMSFELVRFFAERRATFYVRLKASQFVEVRGEKIRVRDLYDQDAKVIVAGCKVRVIRSDQPENGGEPWYILTSDMTSRRRKIIQIYYHRFEIEETFKDLKHILDLVRTKLIRPTSLQLLLWFTSLSLILAYLSGIRVESWVESTNSKKRICWFRLFYESLVRETYRPTADLITGGL